MLNCGFNGVIVLKSRLLYFGFDRLLAIWLGSLLLGFALDFYLLNGVYCGALLEFVIVDLLFAVYLIIFITVGG